MPEITERLLARLGLPAGATTTQILQARIDELASTLKLGWVEGFGFATMLEPHRSVARAYAELALRLAETLPEGEAEPALTALIQAKEIAIATLPGPAYPDEDDGADDEDEDGQGDEQ